MSYSGHEFDEFVEGYIDAILWANTYRESADDGDIESVDAYHESFELSDESRATLEQDCADFINDGTARLINGAIRRGRYSWGQAGHDYALTRNGHGAGFWDRGLGMVGDALTAISKPYGTRDCWVDDDDIVHTD
jgi:hypothetical protein